MQSDFDQLFLAMQEQVNSIQKHCQDHKFGQTCQLKSIDKCSELEKTLSPLEFYIQDSKITIQPKGFLDEIPELIDSTEGVASPRHCLIGIESIPNAENHYRLGI